MLHGARLHVERGDPVDERFLVRIAGVGIQLYGARGRDDLAIVAVCDEGHNRDVCRKVAFIDHEASGNGVEESRPIGLVTVAENLVGTFFRSGYFFDSHFRDGGEESEVTVFR